MTTTTTELIAALRCHAETLGRQGKPASRQLLLEAADEIDRLNRIIDTMDRKQRHGCTDANCQECDS